MMEYRHTSVLLAESVDGLAPKQGGTYCDGTLGGGGHAELICERIGEAGVFIGIDKDAIAIEAAEKRLGPMNCRKVFCKTSFEYVRDVLEEAGIAALDGAILDLGVSSLQLDDAARGFSYMQDGPLDMRMEGSSGDGPSAEDIVNGYSEEELYRIIKEYGEERWAKRIAGFIAKERKRERIASTGRLEDIIKMAIPAAARREGPHPAKRTFQAIRIEINDELGALKRGVEAFMDVLKPGGRLAVITFHSLEDRIVKEAFRNRENPCDCPPGTPLCICGKTADVRRITKKPILPTVTEKENNPRSRSAKLRIVEKSQ